MLCSSLPQTKKAAKRRSAFVDHGLASSETCDRHGASQTVYAMTWRAQASHISKDRALLQTTGCAVRTCSTSGNTLPFQARPTCRGCRWMTRQVLRCSTEQQRWSKEHYQPVDASFGAHADLPMYCLSEHSAHLPPFCRLTYHSCLLLASVTRGTNCFRDITKARP